MKLFRAWILAIIGLVAISPAVFGQTGNGIAIFPGPTLPPGASLGPPTYFFTSGTYTVPAANVAQVYVMVWGAPGSGGVNTVTTGCALGGATGAFVAGVVPVTAGESDTVTVGRFAGDGNSNCDDRRHEHSTWGWWRG